MHATVKRRMPGQRSLLSRSPGAARTWVVMAGVLLAACAAADGKHSLAEPDRDTIKRLAAAERAYRSEAPEYPALRDELMVDPVGAGWLTRLLVRDLIHRREGRPLGQDQDLLRAAASIEDPIEQRAIQEIVVLGRAAVPVLVGDLLLNTQAHTRELGIELLGYVGSPALPKLLEVAESPTPRHRRAAARALAHFTDPESPGRAEAIATLHDLTQDAEFIVRADAVRGLRNGGADAAELLRAMVQNDDDPFVRRTAAMALSGHPGRATSVLLVDYLDRCRRDLETRGYQAAQETLQDLSGARGPRTVAAWRRWAETQTDDTGPLR